MVLLPRQRQVNPAPAHLNALLDCLSSRQVLQCPGVFRKLEDFVWRCERQLPGQRRLQVGFKELAVPAVVLYEAHVDPSPWGTTVAVPLTGLLIGLGT